MTTDSISCPHCGKSASGNFCSDCGTPIISSCPACNAAVKPGARVCKQCGKAFVSITASKLSKAQTIAPWAALSVASIALIVAVMPWFNHSESSVVTVPPLTPMPAFDAAPMGTATGQPPDLSTMTPRQAADRLFNRVMTANENGNLNEALRFAPMALSAYSNVGALDNDARFHVALLHLVSEDSNGAREQIKMLRQAVPQHLLAYMLEYQIADLRGDKAKMAQINKAFLAAYATEMAKNRDEYHEHQGGIERFQAAAQASAKGQK